MNNADLRSCGVISLILGVKVDTYLISTVFQSRENVLKLSSGVSQTWLNPINLEQNVKNSLIKNTKTHHSIIHIIG